MTRFEETAGGGWLMAGFKQMRRDSEELLSTIMSLGTLPNDPLYVVSYAYLVISRVTSTGTS